MKDTRSRLTELRTMPYADYLHTPEWRRRRDRALALAQWRCQWPACGEGLDLNVHHRSYEHLGDERDDELQVLCPRHHQGRHARLDTLTRLHWRVLRDVVNSGPFTSLADVVDLAKYRFHALHLEVSVADLHELFGVLARDLPIINDRPMCQAAIVDTAPRISEREATALLAGLQVLPCLRTMPSASVPPEYDHQAARARAWEMGIEL